MNKIFKSQKRVKKYNANRFIACLLAVFMLFSALSTGSITVHAETDVAEITIDNTTTGYASLEAAITAAGTPATSEDAVEIKMLADIALGGDVTIGNYIALNLNGYTLDLSGHTLSVYGLVSSEGNVVDSSNGKTGLLKAGSFVVSATNTQMPIYNGTDGYRFADKVIKNKRMSAEGAEKFELVFKPDFGGTIKDLLKSDSDADKVIIGVHLEWTDAEKGNQEADLAYKKAIVEDVYANDNYSFYITVTNFENFENLTITPMVQSTLNEEIVCYGEEYTLTAATTDPVITISAQPTAATVEVNKATNLTVAASATENAEVTYQWYSCTDANKTEEVAIENATSATYEVTPTEVGIKYYYCTVSAEGAESITSDVVTVTAYSMLYEEDFEYEGTKPDYLHENWNTASGVYVNCGTVTAVAENEENTALKIAAVSEKFQINTRWSNAAKYTDADTTRDLSDKTVVYQFDLNPNTIGAFRVNLRSQNSGTKLSLICKVDNNVLAFTGVKDTYTLENGKWYNIAVVNDYANGIRDVYLNETRIADDIAIPGYSDLDTSAMNDFIRFHYDTATTAEFMIDNVRVYESNAPITLD